MKKILITLAAIGTMVLAGCSIKGQEPEEPIVYPQVGPLLGEKIADFAEGEADEIFASDGWSNSGDPAFNAVWKKENVTYSNGQMHLGIKAEQAEYEGINYPYTAGEARSHHMYSYGDFEVRMKPTNVTGSVSTFFVCTGPYDLVDGVPNKWDEIDIESTKFNCPLRYVPCCVSVV